jgi:hypothetical protein
MANGIFHLGLRGRQAPAKRRTFIDKAPPLPPVEPPTGWFLRKDVGICEMILLNTRRTSSSVLRHINAAAIDNNLFSPLNMFCPSRQAKQAMIERCIKLVAENQRHRVLFQSLARAWLSKRIKLANEEDLLTGEVPKKLVTVYDWPGRRIYKFEASTILRDMTARLMNHSYLFPKFQLPRNPYTNVDLNVMQFFSIMKQLRSHGQTNWKLEALLELQYSMSEFKEKFGESVKREIIEKQFADLKSEETINIILEHIEDQHELHGRQFNKAIYKWTLENTNCSALRMQFWIKNCKTYNMLNATIRDPQQLIQELTALQLTTNKFCGIPIDLIRKREAQFKKDLVGSGSSIYVSNIGTDVDELEGLIASFSLGNHVLDA